VFKSNLYDIRTFTCLYILNYERHALDGNCLLAAVEASTTGCVQPNCPHFAGSLTGTAIGLPPSRGVEHVPATDHGSMSCSVIL
jgi:hypothetical protein